MSNNKRWIDADIETIKQNYHSKPITEIALMIGRSRAAVYQKAQALNLIKVPRKPKAAVEVREQVAEG